MRQIIAALAIGLAISGWAAAAQRLVPSQYGTVQAAINAAEPGDEVVVAAGNHTGSANFGGKAITVRSTDPNDPAVVNATIIYSGSSSVRTFSFASGETQSSVLSGLTIWGGCITASPYGGAILCQNSSPMIEKCVITSACGGMTRYGVGLVNSSAAFSQCTLSGGSGAMYVSGGSPVVERCIFNSNTVDTSKGAAVENVGGNVLLRNCYLTKNVGTSSTLNWAIHASGGGTITMQGCTLKKNGKIVAETGSYLSITNTIIMPAGDSNRIRLAGNSIADVDWCAVTGLTANASIEAGSILNWGVDNIDPGILQPMGENGNIEAGSIFVNAGDPAYAPLPGEADLAGNLRVVGGRVDIGCCEVPADIVVTSPVEGEVLASGSQRLIKWTSGSQIVDLYFSTDGGAGWEAVVSGQPGVGTYLWTVPLADCNNCLVAGETVDNGETIRGASGIFTMKPYTLLPAADAVWKSIGGDYGRRGLSDSNGPQVGCVKAAIRTMGAVHTGVAIGADGKVYAGCEDGTLQMYLAGMGGGESSSVALGSPITSSPSIGPDGTVYVGCANGRLFALDPNGVVRWTFTGGEMIVGSPGVGQDGKMFVGSTDGALYAFDPDGSELWQYRTASTGSTAFFASPTIGPDGSVYVADAYEPILYCLNPDTGAILWQVDFTMERTSGGIPVVLGRMVAAPAVGPDGTLYAMFEGYTKLYAIEPNGVRKWSKDMADTTSGLFEAYDANTPARYLVSGAAWSEAVVGPDGTIYVGMDDPYVRAVNPADGSIKWVTRCGVAGGFTLTAGADGFIYACSDDKSMYIVGPDGSIAGLFDGEGWLAYPVVAPDESVYVSDSNGVVWVLGRDCPAGTRRDLRRLADVGGLAAVDFVDLAVMAGDWSKSTWDYRNDLRARPADIDRSVNYFHGDVNRDAYVDMADMALVAATWLVEE